MIRTRHGMAGHDEQRLAVGGPGKVRLGVAGAEWQSGFGGVRWRKAGIGTAGQPWSGGSRSASLRLGPAGLGWVRPRVAGRGRQPVAWPASSCIAVPWLGTAAEDWLGPAACGPDRHASRWHGSALPRPACHSPTNHSCLATPQRASTNPAAMSRQARLGQYGLATSWPGGAWQTRHGRHVMAGLGRARRARAGYGRASSGLAGHGRAGMDRRGISSVGAASRGQATHAQGRHGAAGVV